MMLALHLTAICVAVGPAARAANDLAAPPGIVGEQKLIILPTAKYNATCSDGSPVGFHFRPAPAGGQRNKLTIWLKGGDLCNDYKDCVTRKSQCLGSSKYWEQTHLGVAIQSINKTENPDFADWNHAFLEYCSGDVYSGGSPTPVNPWPESGPDKFVFAGHLHLSQVVDHLLDDVLGGAPEEVILTGGSAGGVGTFMNADWLAARLPSSTKFRAMPQGGFFGANLTNYQHFASHTVDPDAGVWPLWLSQLEDRHVSRAEQLCAADHPSRATDCLSPVWAYPYITTPMFVVQASVDYLQALNYAGAPKGKVYTNPTCGAYVEYSHSVQANNLKDLIMRGPKKATDGLFGPACLGHTTVQMGWLGTERVKHGGDGPRFPTPFIEVGVNPRVDNMWAGQAFSDWYFGRTGNHMHLDLHADLETLCACYPAVCGPKA